MRSAGFPRETEATERPHNLHKSLGNEAQLAYKLGAISQRVCPRCRLNLSTSKQQSELDKEPNRWDRMLRKWRGEAAGLTQDLSCDGSLAIRAYRQSPAIPRSQAQLQMRQWPKSVLAWPTST